MVSAAEIAATGVRPPDARFTAVLESAPVTANPWNRPATTLAAAKPTQLQVGVVVDAQLLAEASSRQDSTGET
jgi:hypothetical protein